MDSDFELVYQLLKQGESIVLASIMSSVGSTPRSSGARIIIRSDGASHGTIGGGSLEAEVVREGKRLFRDGHDHINRFILDSDRVAGVQEICGGAVDVLFEYIKPSDSDIAVFKEAIDAIKNGKRSLVVRDLNTGNEPAAIIPRFLLHTDGGTVGNHRCEQSAIEELRAKGLNSRSTFVSCVGEHHFFVEPCPVPITVCIFGAGHVGQQVAKLAKEVGFRVVVVDDREEYANSERFALADEVHVIERFEDALAELKLNPNSYVVIMTRGHQYDRAVLGQVLRSSAGYIGMMGSLRKRETIFRALQDEGITSEQLSRVKSPIGIDISAETPQEIAVSIVAQLIAHRARS